MTTSRAQWIRAAVIGGLLCALVASVACTSEDDPPTTTSTTTTTEPPRSTTTEVPEEAQEAPPAAWIVQIGSAGNDSLLGVAPRGGGVVSTGYTEGDLQGVNNGERDILVAVVDAAGEVASLDQTGTGATDSALGVGSAEATTITCGYTEGSPGAPNAGSADAWCGPVDETGGLGTIHQQGGPEWDRLYGAAVVPDGSYGYASGYTLGLFPGASDTSGGMLGAGDALLWKVDPNGVPEWIRQFGSAGTDWGQGVATTTDGDAVVVGYTSGDMKGPSNGGQDGFIARWDPTGLPRWIRQFGTDALDWPKGAAVGGDPAQGTETLVAVGSTEGAFAPAVGGEQSTVEGDGPSTPAEPSNAGGADAAVAAFDAGGNELWTAQLGTAGAEDAIGVGTDGRNLFVAGNTTGALATNGDPAAGGKDGYLAALDLLTGQVQWITQFGTPGDEDVYSLTITEGLVVVAGQTTGQLGETPNAGGADGFLIAFPLPVAGGSVASSL